MQDVEHIEDEGPEAPRRAWQDHVWTLEEVAFVTQYMRHRNGARAYREAYKPEGGAPEMHASHYAAKLLAQPWMGDYIASLQEIIQSRLKVTTDTVLDELAKLAFANHADFLVWSADGKSVAYDLSGVTHEQLAAIQEVTIDTYVDGSGEDAPLVKSVKVKLAPKIAALELLGKNKKMWTDVVDNTGLADLTEELRGARRRRQEARAQAEQESGEDDV